MRSATRAYGARLFAGYAVASLVPILLLGAALASSIRQDGAAQGLEYGRAQAAVIGETAIAPALSGEDLLNGLTPGEQHRLQDATDLAIYRGSIMRMRIRAFDGRVVFSDDGSIADSVPRSDPAFTSASDGATAVDIVDMPASEAEAIRVLQPVVANANGRSVGILEIYLPYAPVAVKVEAATSRTYWRLGVGLVILYVILGGISWSITRRLRRYAVQREHEALHDPLTGLPNRKLFRGRLEELTLRDVSYAVVLIDLDRFKTINDTLGHHAGDALLRIVADRLTGSLRTDDTVARLGGDEFGVLLPGVDDPLTACAMVEHARTALGAEVSLDDVCLTVEASFGIALSPRDGDDPEALLRSADAAMYQGKRGVEGVIVFDAAYASAPAHDLGLQSDVRKAIEHDQLRLHYQPKIDLSTGEVVGVEALVRWQHPERGLLPPAEFIPAMEQTSLIDPLTSWVLERALKDCAQWTALGATWTVAVNVSARNLDSAGFAATVTEALERCGVSPARLQIELTETALAINADVAQATLSKLVDRGVGVALDDFGVGYASLAHLRSLPLAEVKVDRGFVLGVEDSDSAREVVRSLIQLAHGLGLVVTAEGVENAATTEWLRASHCDNAQGYFFSRPVPWRDLLRSDRASEAGISRIEIVEATA